MMSSSSLPPHKRVEGKGEKRTKGLNTFVLAHIKICTSTEMMTWYVSHRTAQLSSAKEKQFRQKSQVSVAQEVNSFFF